jgi:TDG/mug DNA glycosylase family protein
MELSSPSNASGGGFVLPDVLAPGLRVVFSGTAPGLVSAARKAYYAHPQNRFWRALSDVGLTPRLIKPEEYLLLPRFGLGLTDIAKVVSGMDKDLPAGALGRDACGALAKKIEWFQPRILAFTSLNAGRKFLRHNAAFGEQRQRVGATLIWVLPSPSPAANWNWEKNKGWWVALAEAAGPAPQ